MPPAEPLLFVLLASAGRESRLLHVRAGREKRAARDSETFEHLGGRPISVDELLAPGVLSGLAGSVPCYNVVSAGVLLATVLLCPLGESGQAIVVANFGVIGTHDDGKPTLPVASLLARHGRRIISVQSSVPPRPAQPDGPATLLLYPESAPETAGLIIALSHA